MKEKKDPAALEAFFSLAFLLFLSVTCAFPFTYKRGKQDAQRRGNEHMAERAAQDLAPFDLFTRHLGPSTSLARL